MVFLLYPALPCSRVSAYYAAGYGAQRRKTACKRMVSAVSACGGTDSIGFYERSPRAGVFFAKGLKYSNEIYKWEWGYYFILSWIAVLYLSIGVLLYIKCRVSGCRKKAWIPLVLFIVCIVLCVLREVFDPVFIRMPEAVVFSVVVVFESLIRIGFIPSNVNHEELFYVADVSAGIADKDLNVVLTSKNAPEITREQAMKAANESKTELREDLVLRAKAIRGGAVLWTEDYSLINKINASLAEINGTLSEEGDLIAAENKLKEQRSKIEEQNNLYKGIFAVFRPHLKR